MILKFNYHLHDDAESYERAASILSQFSPTELAALGLSDPTDEDDQDTFNQLIGRPFYEATLECELDTATGDITVVSTAL